MSKFASNCDGKPYECKKEWDEDCFVQCGETGLVLSKKGNYITMFFEAFPKNPKTFIRGEGKTLEEAEDSAWKQFIKYKQCTNHEFERRDYRNGSGICKHCGLFQSNIFEPLEKCCVCGKPTYYTQDKNGKWYCKEHKHCIKPEDMNSIQLQYYERKKRECLKTKEDIIYFMNGYKLKDVMLEVFSKTTLKENDRFVYITSMFFDSFVKNHRLIETKEITINDITYHYFILKENIYDEQKDDKDRVISKTLKEETDNIIYLFTNMKFLTKNT